MSDTIYFIPQQQVSTVWSQLVELAETVPEKDVTTFFEPLRDTDLIVYFESHKTEGGQPKAFGIELMQKKTGGKKERITLTNPDAIKSVYRHLCQEMQDHHGAINEDVYVDVTSVIEEIPAVTQQYIQRTYAGSVFKIEVTFELGDTQEPRLGFIVDRKDIGNGQYTYRVVATSSSVDVPRRNEDKFTLTSLSGDDYTNAKLVGEFSEQGIAVLEFTTSAFLTPCPLAENGDDYTPGQTPFMRVGANYEHARLIDMDSGIPGLSFGVWRVQMGQSSIAPSADQWGSPFFDANGRVSGMLIDWPGDPKDFRFVMPSEHIAETLKQIQDAQTEQRKPTYNDLGIYIEAVANDDERREVLPRGLYGQGVLVTKIVTDSPADGILQPLDWIVAVNDNENATRQITGQEELYRFLETILNASSDEVIKLKVFRFSQGETITLSVKPQQKQAMTVDVSETPYGFNVLDLADKPELSHIPVQGVYVSKQERDKDGNPTPGAIRNGLYHGDIIVSFLDPKTHKQVPTPSVDVLKTEIKRIAKDEERTTEEKSIILMTLYHSAYHNDDATGGIGSYGYCILDLE